MWTIHTSLLVHHVTLRSRRTDPGNLDLRNVGILPEDLESGILESGNEMDVAVNADPGNLDLRNVGVCPATRNLEFWNLGIHKIHIRFVRF